MRKKKFKLNHVFSLTYSKRLSVKLLNRILNECWKSDGLYCRKHFLSLNNTRIKVYPGFKWNGCSPKIRIGHRWFGTPDGKSNLGNQQQMYYPSMIHDILYDNLEHIPFSRKTVDLIFYEMAVKERFKLAGLYYVMVRLFGGIYHWFRRNIRGAT